MIKLIKHRGIHNDKIKELKSLNEKKVRDEKNLFLIEGEHLIMEAYKKKLLKEIIILDNYQTLFDVPKIVVTENVMKYISNLVSIPKIIGVCQKVNNQKIGHKVLLLDNIQDPGNLGTIIRSCVAFNIDTLILSKDTVDIYNSKVIRASQGMLFNIDFIIDDLEKIITILKSKHYKILSTDVKKGKSLNILANIPKVAIIMGNEGNGVSENLQKLSDDFLSIKMHNSCESLNVAVATSIILYELSK